MVIVPQTNIILLKTPMELSDNNQLTWSTLEEQFNYFYNLPKLSLDDATYQRKEGVIRFPTNATTTYEDLLQYNYCMYQNEAYDNKWFYAYIIEINYVNDGMSTIKIETDTWNTWWNDLTFYQSFVEREHVNDDTIGKHTIPEGLETGEYLPSDEFELLGSFGYVVCVGVSENLISTNRICIYNNIYSGLQYIALENSTSLANLLNYYAHEGKIEAVYSLFMIPIKFISDTPIFTWNTKTTGQGNISYLDVPTSYIEFTIGTQEITRPTQLGITGNKYTPKNNKLLTGDYVYILMDNMNGSTAKYNYEYFSNPSACTFKCWGAVNSGCSMKTFPLNYKGLQNNYQEGITNGKLPICSWTSDIYTNWQTQQAVNIGLNAIKSVGSTIAGGVVASTGVVSGGVGTAVGIGMMMSGLQGITNSLAEVYEHSLAPKQAEGNLNNGDINFSTGYEAPRFYKMTIKEEYARCIDSYFSMYGYKVNALKVPNIRGRLNWNYVKTIGCNITGNIPQLDLEKIKSLFDNGITLWHHTNTFLDYSQSNTIIS